MKCAFKHEQHIVQAAPLNLDILHEEKGGLKLILHKAYVNWEDLALYKLVHCIMFHNSAGENIILKG